MVQETTIVHSMRYILGVLIDIQGPALEISSQYEDVPRIFDPFQIILESLRTLTVDISAMMHQIEDNITSLEDNPNLDHRGGWKVFFRILFRICEKLKACIRNLPPIPPDEGLVNRLSRNYLEGLTQPKLLVVKEASVKAVEVFKKLRYIAFHGHELNEKEVLGLAGESYTHPFWYNVCLH